MKQEINVGIAALISLIFACIMALFVWTTAHVTQQSTVVVPMLSSAYPDKLMTPGTIATSDLADLVATYGGLTYSDAHRDVPAATKAAVCREYVAGCAVPHEFDHFISLGLGGSNNLSNLWAEPEHVYVGQDDWGYHTKDRLETTLIAKVKSGTLSVTEAQQCVVHDWVACYKQQVGVTPDFGAANQFDDGEDETQ